MRDRRSLTGRRCASLAIVFLLLVGGPAGTVLADHVEPSREDEIWHVSHHVNATVEDNYATVRVGVEIVNEGPDPEFPFRVELPEDAYVTGLTITRDGQTFEAEIRPADEARQQYDEAKSEERSAAIVEQQRSEDVYVYNVNVEGTETVEAVLTYEQYLTAEAGEYTLPLQAPATHRGIDEGARIDVWLQHTGGFDTVQADGGADVDRSGEQVLVSRDVGPRGQGHDTNLRVAYELSGTQPGGRLDATIEDGTGYFAHRFRADDAQERVPLDMALVLDTSGSMRGEKIEQLKAATRQLVDELHTDDRLHVTFFSGETETPWQGFQRVDTNRTEEAFDALDRVRATGSTNIGAAIADGFAPFDEDRSPERLPALVFLTDGRATQGIHDNERLRTKALEANDGGAHVFSLAFGEDADWSLVHGLAEDGYGLAQRIDAGADAEVDLRSFLTALTSPVLTDVALAYQGEDVEHWRVGAPVLFAGSELLYVGTFDPNRTELPADVTARGPHQAHEWNVSVAVEDDGPAYLSDLVAYERIQALEARIDAEGGNQTLEDRSQELALTHGFVTERTSLVVDLPRQDDRDEPADDQPELDETARRAHDGAQEANQGPTSSRDASGPADGADHEDTQEAAEPAETPTIGWIAVLLAATVALIARREAR